MPRWNARVRGRSPWEVRDTRDVATDYVSMTLVEEVDWYFRHGAAAMRVQGIDYRSIGGGGSVEDDAKHDARLLAPFEEGFRGGLWMRAWVESALFQVGGPNAKILALAFTPRRWQALVDRRAEKLGEEQPPSRSEVVIHKRLTFDPLMPGRIPDKFGGCLLNLAIESGTVRAAYDARTPVEAEARDLPGTELLAFLERTAELAGVPDNRKVSGAAEAVFARIRATALAMLAPAIAAYKVAAESRDYRMHPENLKHGERRRRRDGKTRELLRLAEAGGHEGIDRISAVERGGSGRLRDEFGRLIELAEMRANRRGRNA